MTRKLSLQSKDALNLDDNQFVFTLDRATHAAQFHLQVFTLANLFSNFYSSDNTLTITVAGVAYSVQFDDYITQSNWALYWNTKSPNQNIKIVELANPNTWETVLYFKVQLNGADVLSTISGSACQRLGLAQNVQAVQHKGISIFNFAGPQIIHIEMQGFDVLESGKINSTFQIPVNGAFGSIIQYFDFEHQSENSYKGNQDVALSQIQILFTDERGQRLRSVKSTKQSTGLQGVNFTMILQIHETKDFE